MIDLIGCKGCYGDFLEWDISTDGYCYACQYQHNANLDNKTDEDNE